MSTLLLRRGRPHLSCTTSTYWPPLPIARINTTSVKSKPAVLGHPLIQHNNGPPRHHDRVLQHLPLQDLLRTLSVLSVAALPAPILSTIIHVIRRHSNFISSSPVLRWPIYKTFYQSFCIGESKSDISKNVAKLRSRGLTGIVLSFAREAKLEGGAARNAALTRHSAALKSWVENNKETIAQVGHGDYVAVKLTGAGPAAVKAMEHFNEAGPTEDMGILKQALFDVCQAAKEKNVKLMVDAESRLHQPAIDYLTVEAMAAFNTQGTALVFNTYQMYLKSSLDLLKHHLQLSHARGFTAGIKLVRGAYLYVEPDRSVIHDTKAASDKSYDDALSYLLQGTGHPWKAEVMLATHNSESVDKALALYRTNSNNSTNLAVQAQAANRPSTTGVQKLVFAQLMGMADEISMKLAREIAARNGGLGVYKYTVWGSFEDCLLYMLRRAEENKDAVARSRVTAALMFKEIGHRIAFWRK